MANYFFNKAGGALKNMPRVALVLIALGLAFASAGCAGETETTSPAATTPETTTDASDVSQGKCGDGICDEVERESGRCPQDCPTTSGEEEYVPEPGMVYFGLMVHLEGWDDEMVVEVKFNAHADAARRLASIFETYGAKVTFEARPEFVAGCLAWGDNVLQELHDRGHGVGVHADKGYSPGSDYTLEQFTDEIRQMKEDMEALVDFEVQHVSGICSQLDWARACIDAGYVFTSGGVGYCAQSMPVSLRPEEYRECISPAHCHGNMPLDMAGRIYPWRISTALGDWTQDDPDGELVNLASDSGIKNLYEETLSDSPAHGAYDYDDEDINLLVQKVEEAISLSDKNKVNIIYFSLSIGAADIDIAFYTKMFQALQPYVDAGQLEYKTLNEMYEAYVSG